MSKFQITLNDFNNSPGTLELTDNGLEITYKQEEFFSSLLSDLSFGLAAKKKINTHSMFIPYKGIVNLETYPNDRGVTLSIDHFSSISESGVTDLSLTASHSDSDVIKRMIQSKIS